MAGFTAEIPLHLFQGAEILSLTLAGPSVLFNLNNDKYIILDYYGTIENREDWLYNLPLCGEMSVQSLVGQTIIVEFESLSNATISFSGGNILVINHDDVTQDLVRFLIGDEEYIA